MDRWVGKVAVVTGASAGIGAVIAKDLAKRGVITIALARRVEKIEELKNNLVDEVKQNLVPYKCDVNSEDDIKSTFKWVEKNYGGVDILVNNAGIFRTATIIGEGNSEAMRDTVKTNILAAVFCIREAFRSMKTRENPGHIIIINSIVGQRVGNITEFPMGSSNIYPPTKYAITALTEVVRQELLMEETKIKITVSDSRYQIN